MLAPGEYANVRSLRMQAQGKAWGASLSDRRTAAIARTRFNNRRIKANGHLAEVMGCGRFEDAELQPARLSKLLDEDEWCEDDDSHHEYHLRAKPEFRPVALPSGRPLDSRRREHLSDEGKRAMDVEAELRLADMVERLQAVREGVCDQAQGYRLEIRNKKGKGRSNYRERTNAWLHVRAQTKDVRVHAAIYNSHVRRLHLCFWDDSPQALERYEALKTQFKLIRAEDIRCSTATYETYNDLRTRGDFRLPWFWRMREAPVDDTSEVNNAGDSLDDETFIANCE